MFQGQNRTFKIKKDDLIARVKDNRQLHLDEYEKAVDGYRAAALDELRKLIEKANDGEQKLELKLTEPINNVKHYDDIIEMYTWEIEEEILITQEEFKIYIQDESYSSNEAKVSNSFYNISG